jgi:hypothetical protein
MDRLLHPKLVRVNGDPGDIHAALLRWMKDSTYEWRDLVAERGDQPGLEDANSPDTRRSGALSAE